MSRSQASNDVFRAIVDPTRRAILDRLRAGPANAARSPLISGRAGPPFPSTFACCARARRVLDTRVGRERIYTLDPVPLQSVAGWLEEYRGSWQSSLARLKRNLEEK